ncbi:MAG: N,N-dimethylformamidase [Burkholderiaceae bacterium]|nr:MAG: N,N-dimethylformamidase [Burkholderiaceae bacterium]
MDIQAYFEEWSRLPGETVRMAISTPHRSVRATFERLMSGPGKPTERKADSEVRADVLDATIAGRVQSTAVGSYADLPIPVLSVESATLHLWFCPTLVGLARPQVICALGDDDSAIVLSLRGDELFLKGPVGEFAAAAKIVLGSWYSVAIVLSRAQAQLDLSRVSGWTPTSPRTSVGGPIGLPARVTHLRLATESVLGNGSPAQAFNGKIENPSLYDAVLSPTDIAALHSGDPQTGRHPFVSWAFEREIATQVLIETCKGQMHGVLRNGGDRAVTGHNWTGKSDSFVDKPSEYGAIHFHDDDMIDAGWDYDLEFDLPQDLRSGVYAVRLSAGGSTDHYPLFVRGEAGDEAPILVLMPTNSYLAYGNDHLGTYDLSAIMAHPKELPADEVYLHTHPELGRSCYDVHSDGSPVRYSSRRRPLINVRPGYPNFLTGSYRHFSTDLYLVEWLDRLGMKYHVATDEEVDREGAALFTRYTTVITGSHPEYWTFRGLDSLQSYLGSGGRLMYLGGNGFYWVTSHDAVRPWVVEVRRDNSGTRCWNAPAGERTHASTGEPGGIWRYRGRGPNSVVGVGFATQGFSAAQPFKRSQASYEGPGSRFFEGVSADVVGTSGNILGGAAGDECDRFDLSLGSPPHALVLATASGFGDEYQLVIEDQLMSMPGQGGTQRPDLVRADMVYFEIDGGGAVFSGSSIAWLGALAWNEFDNDIERISRNVLQHFVGTAK